MQSIDHDIKQRIRDDVAYLISKRFHDQVFRPSAQAILASGAVDLGEYSDIYYAGVNAALEAVNMESLTHQPLELAEMAILADTLDDEI